MGCVGETSLSSRRGYTVKPGTNSATESRPTKPLPQASISPSVKWAQPLTVHAPPPPWPGRGPLPSQRPRRRAQNRWGSTRKKPGTSPHCHRLPLFRRGAKRGSHGDSDLVKVV